MIGFLQQFKMAEAALTVLSQKIEKLIAMYESVLAQRDALEQELSQCRSQLERSRERQTTLEQRNRILEDKLNNLQLAGAFTGSSTDSAAAKRRLNAVIKEIDECLAMLNM